MKVEIIAIGSEILSGFTLNSNAAYLSKELLKIGICTDKHTVLPDEESLFKKGFEQALTENDLIICTGGLGPTCDDNTRQWIADIFNCHLIYNEEVADYLTNQFGKDLTTLVNQATLPDKAILLKNEVGTASGLLFNQDQKKIYFLPGVPYEMEEMFKKEVVTRLVQEVNSQKFIHEKWIHFALLKEAQVDPYLNTLKNEIPELNFGIYPSRGKVSVRIFIESKNDIESKQKLNRAIEFLKDIFKEFEFESPNGSLEEAVQHIFIKKNLTLSTAESCTGGAISAKLTSIPGASRYFNGGIVCYSNKIKEDLLKVSSSVLNKHGAVSKETVSEMIEGLMNICGSDIGIAVTGIAGPDGGSPDKPVGTIWVAIQKRNLDPYIWKIETHGNRQMIIEYTVNIILGKLIFLFKN